MRTVLLLAFIMMHLISSGQQVSAHRSINVKVVDSATKTPLINARVSSSLGDSALTDLDGMFTIRPAPSILVTYQGTTKALTRSMADDDTFIVEMAILPEDPQPRGRPVDTTFYSNGRVRSVTYQYRDKVGYFQNGKASFKSVGHSNWTWYKNGMLRSSSVAKSHHMVVHTRWYANGRMKERRNSYWKYDPKINQGAWFSGDDWQFWSRRGKPLMKHWVR